jgi:hypothetical protein
MVSVDCRGKTGGRWVYLYILAPKWGHHHQQTLGSVGWRSKGTIMIDWDSENWGNGVHFAADGSWVTDKHGDDDAGLD